ncbi:MAG: hypothetical protein RLZZ292_3675 [Bacteroidota bacterium]|jgi:orotidine-5'-phosphate decarboxylase
MTRQDLFSLIQSKKTYLCVGLDSDLARIPKHLLKYDDPIWEFNKEIIDATRDYCIGYKPNLAFYEVHGTKGWQTLEKTVRYIGKEHFTIADAKRGDIGNTSKMYAKAFFEQLDFDSVTISPYMGEDSVRPFLGFKEKWAIVLGLTSNVGSQDFQLGQQDDTKERLYEKVLRTVATWGTPEELMFVIGATHPEKFAEIRQIVPEHFFLVPGVGAQGGDLQGVIQHGSNDLGGLLINSSRDILFRSAGEDFAQKAREACLEYMV